MKKVNQPGTLERARAVIREIANAKDGYDLTCWVTRTIAWLEALEAEQLIDEETGRVLGEEFEKARSQWVAPADRPATFTPA